MFLTERNLVNILQQSSINACVALGMTLVIISGGIDLSVGPTAPPAPRCSRRPCWSPGFPILLSICAGACRRRGLRRLQRRARSPMAACSRSSSRSARSALFRASALIYTGGNPILGVPREFRRLFTSAISDLPGPGRRRRGAGRRGVGAPRARRRSASTSSPSAATRRPRASAASRSP